MFYIVNKWKKLYILCLILWELSFRYTSVGAQIKTFKYSKEIQILILIIPQVNHMDPGQEGGKKYVHYSN